MPLEKHTPGDAAFDAEWQSWKQRPELVSACHGDTLLAKIIYRVAGNAAIEYLDSRPPILEGMSPRECLKSKKGLRRLRSALMRFPYI